jgi:hypothetical protein
MISINAIQAPIVRFVFSAYRREMTGQTKAPAIPDDVAVIDKRAIATVPIFNSVRANKIAVPETVAIASESRNHAMRKITACLSLSATLMVFKRDIQAKDIYARQERSFEAPGMPVLRGGPGRSRSHSEEGIVKANHQTPTRKRTRRRGSVDETEVLDMRNRRRMLRIWTNTAAM